MPKNDNAHSVRMIRALALVLLSAMLLRLRQKSGGTDFQNPVLLYAGKRAGDIRKAVGKRSKGEFARKHQIGRGEMCDRSGMGSVKTSASEWLALVFAKIYDSDEIINAVFPLLDNIF